MEPQRERNMTQKKKSMNMGYSKEEESEQ